MTGDRGEEHHAGRAGDRRRSHDAHSDLSGSAGDVVQARDVKGGVHFHSSSGVGDTADTPKPRQLPGDIRGFINRTEELGHLDAILSGAEGEPLVVSVCVVAGTAGAGKTSLALHWAHQSAEDFPDGQLYVNLRGYDPGPPVTSEEALHQFLRALGVPPAAIPADTESAAALYRSVLADRRILVVLDNAATAAQVRPLLPGTARCLVLVTSRSRLSGLAVRDGARRLTLGTLPDAEAVALLRTVTAGYRAEDDVDKVAELAHLCACLPLALRIAAERAASRPHMSLDDLIRDLRDESSLWDALTTGDDEESDAVRTVFAWSYRALSVEAARVFRLLGLHPGPGFSASAAAALTGTDIAGARRSLDLLVGVHLLDQTAPDRFEFHDLLRAYAIDQAQHEEPPENRDAALCRVLFWYAHSAAALRVRVSPLEPPVPLDPPPDAVRPLTFADHSEAIDWYELEHRNLLSAATAAAESGHDRLAWQLPALLRPVHARLNSFAEWQAMGEIGLQAARREGDRWGEAEVLASLGKAFAQSQRLPEALEHHVAALALRRELGDREGEALARNAIGLVKIRDRQLAEAQEEFTAALALFREIGAVQWEATVLSHLASVAYDAGRLDEALDYGHRTLAAHRSRGDRRGEGKALDIIGSIQRERGDVEAALGLVQSAVDIGLELRNRALEGFWLISLGNAQQANGRYDDALASYQRAAVLQRQLGDRSREARAWHGTGEAYRRLGRAEDAVPFCRQAVARQRELDDRWQLAVALDGLALAAGELGRRDEARRHWEEALGLLAEYDDPRAERMRQHVADALRELDSA